MYNLLGFFPAPFIYGVANELSDNPKTSNYGMVVVMLACLLVTFSIFMAMLSDKEKNYFGFHTDKNTVIDVINTSPIQIESQISSINQSPPRRLEESKLKALQSTPMIQFAPSSENQLETFNVQSPSRNHAVFIPKTSHRNASKQLRELEASCVESTRDNGPYMSFKAPKANLLNSAQSQPAIMLNSVNMHQDDATV